MFTQLDVLIKFLCCVVRSYDTSTKIVANSDLGWSSYLEDCLARAGTWLTKWSVISSLIRLTCRSFDKTALPRSWYSSIYFAYDCDVKLSRILRLFTEIIVGGISVFYFYWYMHALIHCKNWENLQELRFDYDRKCNYEVRELILHINFSLLKHYTASTDFFIH